MNKTNLHWDLLLPAVAALIGSLMVRQRIEVQREAQRRRLESLARAGAGLAHQLRTPLATIKGSCQLVGEQLGQSPLAARIETSVEQADRMERMLGMLLDFARPRSRHRPQPRRGQRWRLDAAPAGRWRLRGGPGPGVDGSLAVTPTILVVDDDPAFRALVVEILAGAGYLVREAASAEEALVALAAESELYSRLKEYDIR